MDFMDEREDLSPRRQFQEAVQGEGEARVLGLQLVESAKHADARGVKRLIEQGADVNVQDDLGATALHHAAAMGARPCIRLLVKSGKCDYLLRDNKGRYASELAWARDCAVAELLSKKEVRLAYERKLEL